jgi:hypothetical protein
MATTGVGEPFNKQYPSGFTFPINEDVFRRKNPAAFKAYKTFIKNSYEEAVAEGTPPTIALERANDIGRRFYFQEAVKVGAAVDPNPNDTRPDSIAPVPESSSRPKPLPTTTSRTTTPRPPPPPPPSPAPRPPQSTTGTTGTTKTSGSGSTPKSKVSPNVLHNYVNYTYRLSLYALKSSEFNRLVVNPQAKVDKALLISSGGSGKNKAAAFDLDFYFEDLDVATIISPTSTNRETNAYDVNFTIFEPNGCTLIDRLIAVTKKLAGPSEDNYLTMPYLLEISFLGYDEMGNPKSIGVANKIIPVYLTDMKIKPNFDGTRYVIRAQPFNQNALTQTAGIVPVNCEIKADTIDALFRSTGVLGTGVSQAVNSFGDVIRQSEETLNTSDNALERDAATRQAANAREQVKKPITASSLGNFLNEWQKYLVDNEMIGVADEYDFLFEPEIGSSKVILPQLNPVQDVPTNNSRSSADATSLALLNARRAGIVGSAGTGVTRIFAGTSITQILGYAVRHCSFILDQLPDTSQTPQTPANNTDARGSTTTDSARNNAQSSVKEEKILKWFWVTPRVEIKEFDKIRNTYAKKITYIVSIYDSPNPRYPGAPQGQAQDYVKEYNYWYTGDNTDILNVDINFDTAFYTSVSLPNSATLQGQVRPSMGGNDTQPDEQTRRAAERSNLLAKTGLPFPVVRYPSKQQADLSAAGKSAVDQKSIAADDLAESLMSRSRGDMVTLKLEILGDPEFIKQDGLFGDVPSRSSNKNNGSLVTNHGRVIVKFNFNYPNDWGRDRGLLTARAHRTVFEGLYGVVKVDSKFDRGLFKQTLDLYRLYEKDYEEPPEEPAAKINPLTRSVTGGVDRDNSLIDTGQ